MSRLFHVGFPFSVLDGDCFSSSSTWSLAFLRADTQVGGVTRRTAHFGDSAGNCPGFSSMASMGWWGFPAASVSCSAIMHRTPLNRNPWNRSLPQNKHHSYSRIFIEFASLVRILCGMSARDGDTGAGFPMIGLSKGSRSHGRGEF